MGTGGQWDGAEGVRIGGSEWVGEEEVIPPEYGGRIQGGADRHRRSSAEVQEVLKSARTGGGGQWPVGDSVDRNM